MSDIPWRATAAAIVAIVGGAAAGVAISVIATGWPIYPEQMLSAALFVGVPIAAFHALFVGAPLYAIARRRWSLTWCNAALGGVLTGCIPAAAWCLICLPGAIVRGDLVEALAVSGGALLFFGASGAVAGIVYRAVRGARPVARP